MKSTLTSNYLQLGFLVYLVVFHLQSERNDAFYDQPGVKFHYPKDLIYPKTGGEVSLEHVKASLPQYCPLFPDEEEGEGEGEDDMDLTVAGGGTITTHISVVPDFLKPGAMQLVEKSSSTNTGKILVR